MEGAAGYLVRRADRIDGEFVPLEIGQPWVVRCPMHRSPTPPARRTAGVVHGRRFAAVDDHEQTPSTPVEARPLVEGEASCRIELSATRVDGLVDRPCSR